MLNKLSQVKHLCDSERLAKNDSFPMLVNARFQEDVWRRLNLGALVDISGSDGIDQKNPCSLRFKWVNRDLLNRDIVVKT